MTQPHHGHTHGGGPPDANQAAQARARIEAMKRQFEQKKAIADSLSEIKHKIGVYSGKGGVGKTTVAVNLAVTLAQQGAKVGILDVDIDCPNVIRAMRVAEPPTVGETNRMIPPEQFGVSVMSMGFFQQNENEATIWRGPMIHNAINQILQTTIWGSLDYLIMDLPPGTSDAPSDHHAGADHRRVRRRHHPAGTREGGRLPLNQHDKDDARGRSRRRRELLGRHIRSPARARNWRVNSTSLSSAGPR